MMMMNTRDEDEELNELEKGVQIQALKTSIVYHSFMYYVYIFFFIAIPLFICGWISDFVNARDELIARHHFLLKTGPPEECESFSVSYLSSFFWKNTQKQICQTYYIELQQTENIFPNLWQVTLVSLSNTFIQPFHALFHMISELPYFLQYGLLCIVAIFIVAKTLSFSLFIPWFQAPPRPPSRFESLSSHPLKRLY